MSFVLRNDIFIFEQMKYRILEIRDSLCLVVCMDSCHTKIKEMLLEDIQNGIEKGYVELYQDEKETKIIDFEQQKKHGKQIRDNYKILHKMFDEYSPNSDWMLRASQRADFLKKFAVKCEVSLSTARRMFRTYLQSGRNVSRLGSRYYNCGGKNKNKQYKNGKRPGRQGISKVAKTQETVEHFETMMKRYVKMKTKITYSQLYEDMVEMFYTEKQVVHGTTLQIAYPAVARPTQRQLYYYIKKKLNEVKKYELRNGYRQAQNNIRPLHSDTIANLPQKTIGARYEIDEMETDFFLVSRLDRTKVIGRAILYLAVDVFSKMAVGYSIGVDNNAWTGVEMLLLNMVENKVEACKRVGISIQEEDWPVHAVLPKEIQVDNGSEYLSKDFENFAASFGMSLSFTPPAMGSMKPNVEQKFRQFNLMVKGRLPGVIEKDSYGRPHIRNARLNIEEFEKVVVQFILAYNRTPMDEYPDNKELFEAGISLSPIEIWNYYLYQTNGLQRIENMEQYKFSLLSEANATITREGIKFKKMFYTCSNLEWLEQKMSSAALKGKSRLKIRYDKRNMDFIYFLSDDGILKKAWLNKKKTCNEKYFQRSFFEVEEINSIKKASIKENAEKRLEAHIAFNQEVRGIVKEANKGHKGPNSSKNISENRKKEKELLHKEKHLKIDIQEPEYQEQRKSVEEIDHRRIEEKAERMQERKKTTQELIEEQRRKKYQSHLTP
ncbi:MAG: DDE-type integrase/transposase/recombinase [Blautia hansenii]